MAYRKGIRNSPAYRLNHEEVAKALEEGIWYAEKLSPTEALMDEYDALDGLLFEKQEQIEGRWKGTGETVQLPARSLFVAAGTSPNVIYEREHPGSFEMDERGKFFKRYRVEQNGQGPRLVSDEQREGKPGIFTSHLSESADGRGRVVSYFGDNHPDYAGNVVKAMASARDGYGQVVALFADEIASLDPAGQAARDRDWDALAARMDEGLQPRVHEVLRLTPTIVEVIVKAPFAARHFQPGQFYRLQNYETLSPSVNGTILDQFSLSEHNGFLRVATTTGQWGRWWLPAEEQSGPENHVFVLEQVIHAAGSTEQSTELNVVGHVGGIAVGERIWSSRFVGDRGYLVTFRNIDPLWTLDLSDPANPQVIGELEVPGVSTYIHPLDENHLLTIGIAGDENGLDWGSTQLSLFDVTDFENPVLASKLELSPVPEDEMYGWNWAWSEATYEHKAFQYWNGQLAIPLSTSRYTWDESGYGHYEYVSKLVLVDVSTETGLSIYDGTSIDHSMFYEMDEWYWDRPDIRRTVFIDDYVYAISQQGVTVHKLDTMALTDYAGLPVSDPDPGHYYEDWEEKPGEEREDESDPNDPDDEESDENGTTSSDNSG